MTIEPIARYCFAALIATTFSLAAHALPKAAEDENSPVITVDNDPQRPKVGHPTTTPSGKNASGKIPVAKTANGKSSAVKTTAAKNGVGKPSTGKRTAEKTAGKAHAQSGPAVHGAKAAPARSTPHRKK